MTTGLMGVPEYREMVENAEAAQERYDTLASVVAEFVDIEAAVSRALARLDHEAVAALRDAQDTGR